MRESAEICSTTGFAWSIAEILRGNFKQSEYGKVILPFAALRRLDCILEPTRQAVRDLAASLPEGLDGTTRDTMLFGAVDGNIRVYNLSRLTFGSLRGHA